MLKRDKIDGILLDIRQTILSFKDSKSKLINKTENTFKILINIVKDRMGEILEEVDHYYEEEIKTIKDIIVEWFPTLNIFNLTGRKDKKELRKCLTFKSQIMISTFLSMDRQLSNHWKTCKRHRQWEKQLFLKR